MCLPGWTIQFLICFYLRLSYYKVQKMFLYISWKRKKLHHKQYLCRTFYQHLGRNLVDMYSYMTLYCWYTHAHRMLLEAHTHLYLSSHQKRMCIVRSCSNLYILVPTKMQWLLLSDNSSVLRKRSKNQNIFYLNSETLLGWVDKYQLESWYAL